MCRGSRVAASRSKWASEARQSRPEQLRYRGPPRWHAETRDPEGTNGQERGGDRGEGEGQRTPAERRANDRPGKRA